MADTVTVVTSPSGVGVRSGVATPGGDGRQSDQPLYFVAVRRVSTTAADGTVTVTYDPVSSGSPQYVALSDGRNTVTVLSVGPGQNALVTRDQEVRRLIEQLLEVENNVLIEIQKLTQGIMSQ